MSREKFTPCVSCDDYGTLKCPLFTELPLESCQKVAESEDKDE